ncbi:uncharacterized protein LOC143212179 [Lasioglossum baleicum]|uniref:uncharacterized protein LOC143212179 n=1 Tax=Lasioglossum baleicum TaxID=434251 RepID=UPI003FCC3C0F
MSNAAADSLEFMLRGTESVHVSQESKDAFKNCMNTEAIYKAGIPWGTFTAICVYGMCSYHKVKPMMKLVTIPFGIMGFNLGRLTYSQTCATKYVPELPDLLRAKLLDMQRRNAQDNKLFESNELWSEDQTSSNEFNTTSGDNSNQFPDASSDTDTPETSKLNEPKQRVTYEELRRQNRIPYYGGFRSRQPVQEKVPTADPELLDEESINKTKQRIWE